MMWPATSLVCPLGSTIRTLYNCFFSNLSTQPVRSPFCSSNLCNGKSFRRWRVLAPMDPVEPMNDARSVSFTPQAWASILAIQTSCKGAKTNEERSLFKWDHCSGEKPVWTSESGNTIKQQKAADCRLQQHVICWETWGVRLETHCGRGAFLFKAIWIKKKTCFISILKCSLWSKVFFFF